MTNIDLESVLDRTNTKPYCESIELICLCFWCPSEVGDGTVSVRAAGTDAAGM